MAMMAREAWTDERLDDLEQRARGIDRRTMAEFRAVRAEMREEIRNLRRELQQDIRLPRPRKRF